MAIQTTIGWSLITLGVVTLLLAYLPYPSFDWGIGLLAVGILLFVTRRVFDRTGAQRFAYTDPSIYPLYRPNQECDDSTSIRLN